MIHLLKARFKPVVTYYIPSNFEKTALSLYFLKQLIQATSTSWLTSSYPVRSVYDQLSWAQQPLCVLQVECRSQTSKPRPLGHREISPFKNQYFSTLYVNDLQKCRCGSNTQLCWIPFCAQLLKQTMKRKFTNEPLKDKNHICPKVDKC